MCARAIWKWALGLHKFLRGPAICKAEELSVLGSNGEERGREWSRLCLRGREEAIAGVLACAGEPADGWVRRAVRRRRATVQQAYSSARACRDEDKTTGRSSKLNGAASKLAEGARVRGRDGDWTGSGVWSSLVHASQVAQKL